MFALVFIDKAYARAFFFLRARFIKRTPRP